MTAIVEPSVTTDPGISNMASGFSKLCRTCASCTDCLMPIFHGEGLLNNLPEKIQRHLPIQVSEWDRLPQQLCRPCADTLLAWHELVECCSQADAALRTRLQRLRELRPEENVPAKSEEKAAIETIEEKEKPVKCKIDFRKYLEDILVNYIDVTSQNMGMSASAGSAASTAINNIIYVCQKCERYSPFHTVESLAGHLEDTHSDEIADEAAIALFVAENLILVETLDESLPVKSVRGTATEEAKEIVSLARVRPRRQIKTTDADLDKLCCPFCPKIFSASKRLLVHLNVHPEVNVGDGYMCKCCSLSWRNPAAFIEHMQREHVKIDMEGSRTVCRSCGLVCDDKLLLQEHVTSVHGSRPGDRKRKLRDGTTKSGSNSKYVPVECPICGRTVSNKYNLSAHMRHHTEPPHTARFACDECGRSYRSRGSLKSHVDVVHRGLLKYVCPECGEAFPSKVYRDVHRRIHSGETPFTCAVCGGSFRSKNSLVSHMKSHLGIRNYACELCSKRFHKSTHLKLHLRTHEKRDRIMKKSNKTQHQKLTEPVTIPES